MPSALINIARTGAAAARAGLDLTAQNIANASNADYTRRTLSQSELVGTATIDFRSSNMLGGVLIGDIERVDSALLQSQVRASTADLARTDAEISGLRTIESALEQSRVFGALTNFEASLLRLESDPLDPALRSLALESGRQLADTFQLADRILDNSTSLAQVDLATGVDAANKLAGELARINVELNAAQQGSIAQAGLLDQRDAVLRDLSAQVGIATRFEPSGAVEVTLEGASSPFVQRDTVASLTVAFAADGTASFALDGAAFSPQAGAIAGRATALQQAALASAELDTIALNVIDLSNMAQASGAAEDGSAGQPFFSGGSAADIALALSQGGQIATAPAGSPPGSRNTANLGNLITGLGADTGPSAQTDTLLLGLSSRIAGLDTRREGLAIVASGAEAALAARVGVDLDTEAANLVRLQQAFEANGRVIQVATDVFDTILALR